jgi:hypothetical protein
MRLAVWLKSRVPVLQVYGPKFKPRVLEFKISLSNVVRLHKRNIKQILRKFE